MKKIVVLMSCLCVLGVAVQPVQAFIMRIDTGDDRGETTGDWDNLLATSGVVTDWDTSNTYSYTLVYRWEWHCDEANNTIYPDTMVKDDVDNYWADTVLTIEGLPEQNYNLDVVVGTGGYTSNTVTVEILSKAVDDGRKNAAYPWCYEGTKFQQGKGYATCNRVRQR
ncbi:MAG: hypothetical protein SVV80_14515, partial [Planctomycetota bacterium]|nr:hypothetical protein [Planctomycetota bacterium]